MSRQIVHATDFSSASRPAFAKAMGLAKRDRTGLVVVRFFVGSVAGRVVAGATCPVVTVRGK